MKNRKQYFTIIAILAILFNIQAVERYKDHVFTGITRENGITYRTAVNAAQKVDTLKLDYYTPEGDNETKRPLIIFIHGGSFVMGTRSEQYAVGFCSDMAMRGYAVASISYRLGVQTMSETEFRKAIYRAVQDSKGAVRFFRAHAAEYGIDPNIIILAGYSAGAITTLHHAYIGDEDAAIIADPDLMGELDSGDYTDFSSSVNVAVSFSGAIGDTLWMSKGSVPVISIHGTADNVVPFSSGNAFSLPTMPLLYGSGTVHAYLEHHSIVNKLVSIENETHNLTTNSWSNSFPEVASFIYGQMTPISSVQKSPRLAKIANAKSSMLISIHKPSLVSPAFNLKGRQIPPVHRKSSAGTYLIRGNR